MDPSNPHHDRPPRRTALIASELGRYSIDIAALSETRLPEVGSLTEEGGGYTFFWKGLPANAPRIHGVGFAVRTSLLISLPDLPNSVNERIMTLRIPLAKHQFATIVSVYAPTLVSDDVVKDAFYSALDETILGIPQSDKVWLVGDFNARVGKNSGVWPGVLGPHGVGKMNDNGLRLLTFCTEHCLSITSTQFQLPDKLKTTWMHPRSKSWHMLDYAIVRQRDLKEVLVTRAMRGANCWTDHRLVRSRIRVCLRRPPRKSKGHPRLNVAVLADTDARCKLADAVNDALNSASLPDDPAVIADDLDSVWDSIHSSLLQAAKSAVGTTSRKNPDWFDESAAVLGPLLDAKNRAHDAHLSNPRSRTLRRNWINLRSEAQRTLRKVQNEWWVKKAREIQAFADTNNSYGFYSAVKSIYGPTSRSVTPVRSADGASLIKEKKQVLNRWAEHFQELLNRVNPTDPSALDELPTLPPILELDIPPTLPEVRLAVSALKNKKAPGGDGLPAEVFKFGGNLLLARLHAVFLACWRERRIPARWKHATIIPIYKRKGDRSDCGNSRGIALLDVAGKVLARILLRRLLRVVTERVMPESQCGFRTDRSTLDMILVARLLIEKSREQRQDIALAFIDLTKAFDTVNRDLLWRTLEKIGCPPTFVSIVRAFHVGMEARVSVGGETSDPFGVIVGVKQGCVLAPVIFNLFIMGVTILSRGALGRDDGIRIRYRFDGSVFNTSRLKAKTKTHIATVFELQYADDAAAVARDAPSLQRLLNSMHSAYSRLGLAVNANKTEIIQTDFHDDVHAQEDLRIGDAQLKNTESFTYLGSIITAHGIDEEITSRIAKASAAFGRLRHRVFTNKHLRLYTKIAVFRAVVVSTLLYSCECWTPYRRHVRQLESFQARCLMRILGLTWEDYVPHVEVLIRAGTSSVESSLLRRLFRWLGHVIRMSDNRLPKMVLFGELDQGTRPVGRPKLRFKDHIKSAMKRCDLLPQHLETLASDRLAWRRSCEDGVAAFETRRTEEIRRKRQLRLQRARARGGAEEEGAADVVVAIDGLP